MMNIFLITFGVMLTVIVIMAIGYIVKGKTIKGSCGGISDLGMEKVCDCDEPCDKRKEMMRKQAEKEKAEQQILSDQNRISVSVIDS